MLIILTLVFLFGAAAAVALYRPLSAPHLSPRDVFYRVLVSLSVLLGAAALLFLGFLAYAGHGIKC